MFEPIAEPAHYVDVSETEVANAAAVLAGFTDGVELTPTQSNEIILDKLTHLLPMFERVRDSLLQLRVDLSNGIVHWEEILEGNWRCR